MIEAILAAAIRSLWSDLDLFWIECIVRTMPFEYLMGKSLYHWPQLSTGKSRLMGGLHCSMWDRDRAMHFFFSTLFISNVFFFSSSLGKWEIEGDVARQRCVGNEESFHHKKTKEKLRIFLHLWWLSVGRFGFWEIQVDKESDSGWWWGGFSFRFLEPKEKTVKVYWTWTFV